MRPVRITQSGAGSTAPVPIDIYQVPTDVTYTGKVVAGAPTYSIEWTTDDVWDPAFNPATATWQAGPANVTAANSTQTNSLVAPVSAIRLRVTAGTVGVDIVQLIVIQPGLRA